MDPDVRRLAADVQLLRERIDALQLGLTPSGGGWESPTNYAPLRVGDEKMSAVDSTADHTTDGFRWLYEDGRAVSRTTEAALFAVIGTKFGVGDGSTTFNLPDSRNRYPLGAGTGNALGSSDAAAEADRKPSEHGHGLTVDIDDHNLGHTHPVTVTGHTVDSADASASNTGEATGTGMGPALNLDSYEPDTGHTHDIPADAFQHHTHGWSQDTGAAGAESPDLDVVSHDGGDSYIDDETDWPPRLARHFFILASRPA